MAEEPFDEGDKIRRIAAKLDDPTKALEIIGEFMVSESLFAFSEKGQALGKDKWPERKAPNVFGIIADFAKQGGGKPPGRRFETTPALNDSGHLAGSIAKEVAGDKVSVGTNVPYARVHHEGGTTKSEKITQSVQEKLAKWLKKDGKDHRDSLGWILNKKFTNKQLEMKVPRRPIVGFTKQTAKDVAEILGDFLEAEER